MNAGFSCSEISGDDPFSHGMKRQTILSPNPHFSLKILKQKNLIFFHSTPNIYEIFSYPLLGRGLYGPERLVAMLKELKFFIIYSL